MLRQQTAHKISARAFTKAYLEPLLLNTFELLTARGYFYDNVKAELETFFIKPLTEEAVEENICHRRARLAVDGIIKQVCGTSVINMIPPARL